jgi:hypothetical protein
MMISTWLVIHGRLTRLTMKNLDFYMGSQLNAKRNGDFRRETGVSRIRSHPWSFWASDNSSSRFLASQIMNPHFGDFWSLPCWEVYIKQQEEEQAWCHWRKGVFFFQTFWFLVTKKDATDISHWDSEKKSLFRIFFGVDLCQDRSCTLNWLWICLNGDLSQQS